MSGTRRRVTGYARGAALGIERRDTEFLAKTADECDAAIGIEANCGPIAHEHDYTSALMTSLRQRFNAGSKRLTAAPVALPLVPPPAPERGLGVDAAIVLKQGGKYKLCLFKAKAACLQQRKEVCG